MYRKIYSHANSIRVMMMILLYICSDNCCVFYYSICIFVLV